MTSPDRLVLHQVLDPQHGNVVAAVFEAPAGWTVRSGVWWNFQNVSFPVLAGAKVAAPDGIDAFEFLPAESFYWLQPDYGMCQPGANQLGQTCMPPMSAADAFGRWVIPKHRGRAPGLKILSMTPRHDVAPPPAEGILATIEYVDNGRPIEESFVGARVQQNVPYYGPQGMTMQINWGFAKLFCFRSAKGRLAERTGPFQRIAGSLRVNPLWERLCADVMRRLQAQFDQFIAAGYSQIQAAGQLSRQISANNDALLAGFEQQRQAAASHSRPSGSERSPADGFSDYMRGVETVNDPYTGTSQQDYNYQYHWTDGSGNYQHSNDPFFNPNIGSGLNWTLMERPKS